MKVSFLISQYSNCLKLKTVYGSVPSASSGQVYPLYPSGITYQNAMLSIRIYGTDNIIVNPSWAEVSLYQNNAHINFINIPQGYQGGTYYLDFATT